MTWQTELLDRIRGRVPDGSVVRPYGSVTAPETLDRWSDLDVEVDLTADVGVDALLGGTPWAWQDVVDDGTQRVRVVLEDGRRVDLAARGSRLVLPLPTADNGTRFDSALAAVRFGRGNDLVGLHLVLGIVRGALVDVMVAIDRAEGTDHHRVGSSLDAWAMAAQEVLAEPLGAALVRRAVAFAERCRALTEPGARADWSGLDAVLERGGAPQVRREVQGISP